MQDHRTEFRVTTMSRVLKVHRSDFYSWLKNPESKRTKGNRRFVDLIRHCWKESDRS